MKITFKDVGQGDSIILEWEEKGNIIKYGIIDCNLYDNKNPVLSYLKSLQICKIEFIILSHPHDDHFSGLNDLLCYCEEKDIKVGVFYHTSFSIPEYLKSAVTSIQAKKELDKLFKNVNRLIKKGIIKKGGYITDDTKNILLGSDCYLEFLAPTHKEYDDFNKRKYRQLEEIKINRSDGNLLSTFIKVYSHDWMFFLTSDTTEGVFNRYLKKHFKELSKGVIFGQASHHGAFSGSYYYKFWKKIIFKENTPAIISVGENHYGHPDNEVILSLEKFGYNVFRTDANIHTIIPEENPVSHMLDIFSELINKIKSGGDIILNIKNGELLIIQDNGPTY